MSRLVLGALFVNISIKLRTMYPVIVVLDTIEHMLTKSSRKWDNEEE